MNSIETNLHYQLLQIQSEGLFDLNDLKLCKLPGKILDVRFNYLEARGRPKQSMKKCTLFLLRTSNADYYPCVTECAYLQENGFGKLF